VTRKLFAILLVLAGLGTVGAAQATVITFDFNGVAAGTTTPLTLSVGGVQATLTSTPDAGGFFTISPIGFLSLTDTNVLVSQTPEVLDITFNQTVTSISAEFATDGSGPLSLTALTGGLNGTSVGTSSATGGYVSNPYCDPDCFPQGTISLSGSGFDSLILSDSVDPAFALGTFTVDTGATSVPEPSSLALLALALALLGGFVSARNRRAHRVSRATRPGERHAR
jgi:hypothetical protein